MSQPSATPQTHLWLQIRRRKTQWPVPAQACESWPVTADWAFGEGCLKETFTKIDVGQKNIKPFKNLLVDTPNKSKSLKISIILDL